MNNSEMQIAGTSAAAAMGEYAAKEKMAGWYLSNLVQTLLKPTFLLIHATLRRDMRQPMNAKLHGEWVETNPAEWTARRVVDLTVGLTQQERRDKLGGLTTLIQKQGELLAQGEAGILTSKAKMHSAMADWIRCAEIGDPDEYIIDPESDEAVAASKQQQQTQAQQQQKIEQLQMAMYQAQQKLEWFDRNLEEWKHKTQLEQDYYEANLDAEVAEAKMVSSNVADITKAVVSTGGDT